MPFHGDYTGTLIFNRRGNKENGYVERQDITILTYIVTISYGSENPFKGCNPTTS